jgi:SAM-dependent methyltransferase
MTGHAAGQDHWTHRLFVERPELYLPFLEHAEERAQAEAGILADLFGRFGVPEGGKVLDVACGTGRLAIPLARRGYRVTGIDLSPLYIDKARERSADEGLDVDFIVGDMRGVESVVANRGPLDAVIIMFTSNGYYGRDGDLKLFRQLWRLSSPGAIMVVLTMNRDWMVANFEPEGVDAAGAFRILQRHRLDLETSTLRNDWEFYEGDGDDLRLQLRLQLDHRVYSLHDLKALVEEAGWEYLAGLGSDRGAEPCLRELTLDLMEMWVVSRVARQHAEG